MLTALAGVKLRSHRGPGLQPPTSAVGHCRLRPNLRKDAGFLCSERNPED